MTKIFISYRRADSISATGRIFERLVRVFGDENVFKDVEDIQAGEDFRQVLHDAVDNCDVVLVIIGRQWATVTGQDGNLRLHNGGDFVRAEVASALANPSVKTIPVLVEGAAPPTADQLPDNIKDLVYRNMVQVRNDPDFNVDMQRLLKQLDPEGKFYKEAKPGRSGFPLIPVALTAAVVVIIIAVALFFLPEFDFDEDALEEAVDIALDDPESQDFIAADDTLTIPVTGSTYVIRLYEGTGDRVEFYAGIADYDAFIGVYDDEGELIADNEDCTDDTLDACVEFVAANGGLYAIAVSDSVFETINGQVILTSSTE